MIAVGSCLPAHYSGILELQRLVHRDAVDAETAALRGFVSWRHTFSSLRIFNAPVPHTVAIDGGGRLVGYALSMDPQQRWALPAAKEFVDALEQYEWEGAAFAKSNYVCMGQIAIHPDCRGGGLFRRLYEHWFAAQAARYDLAVTEIAVNNSKSLAAHAALGWREATKHHDGQQAWIVVAKRLR